MEIQLTVVSQVVTVVFVAQRFAQQLQEKERRRYELKKRERELVKERKRLEQEQQQRACDPQVMLAGYRKENLGEWCMLGTEGDVH